MPATLARLFNSSMFANIPTYVLAGPLGAGKTSIARDWLAQKPDGERWAVLVNEFGDIGLDAALLGPSADGISVTEVAGGCICCVNGAPFTIALSRLIKNEKPDRLLIELSGLSHPLPLIQQLRAEPWSSVLALKPLMVVLDGPSLMKGVALAPPIKAAMASACMLIVNKADAVPLADRAELQAVLGGDPLWVNHGRLDWNALVHASTKAASASTVKLSVYTAPQADGWSIGWQQPAEQVMDLRKVEALLAGWPWTRAKMIIHSIGGWYSANLLPGQPIQWRTSEWRKDSRLEMMFDEPQPRDRLNEAWEGCRVPS